MDTTFYSFYKRTKSEKESKNMDSTSYSNENQQVFSLKSSSYFQPRQATISNNRDNTNSSLRTVLPQKTLNDFVTGQKDISAFGTDTTRPPLQSIPFPTPYSPSPFRQTKPPADSLQRNIKGEEIYHLMPTRGMNEAPKTSTSSLLLGRNQASPSSSYMTTKKSSEAEPAHEDGRLGKEYEIACCHFINRKVAMGGATLLFYSFWIFYTWQTLIWTDLSEGFLNSLLGFGFIVKRSFLFLSVLIPYIAFKRVFYSTTEDKKESIRKPEPVVVLPPYEQSSLYNSALGQIKSSHSIQRGMGLCASMLISSYLTGFLLLKDYVGWFCTTPFEDLISLNQHWIHILCLLTWITVCYTFRLTLYQEYVIDYYLSLYSLNFQAFYCLLNDSIVYSTLVFFPCLLIYYLTQDYILYSMLFFPKILFKFQESKDTQLCLTDIKLLILLFFSCIIIHFIWTLALLILKNGMTKRPNIINEEMTLSSALSGLDSHKQYVQNLAFIEVLCTVSYDPKERSYIFQDLDQSPTFWVRIRNSCLRILKDWKHELAQTNAFLLKMLPKLETESNSNGLHQIKLLKLASGVSEEMQNDTLQKKKSIANAGFDYLAKMIQRALLWFGLKSSISESEKEMNLLSKLKGEKQPPPSLFPKDKEMGTKYPASFYSHHNKESIHHGNDLKQDLVKAILIFFKELSQDYMNFLNPITDFFVDFYQSRLFYPDYSLEVSSIKLLCVLVSSSLEEDSYGQIQRDFPEVWINILDTLLLIEDYLQYPRTPCGWFKDELKFLHVVREECQHTLKKFTVGFDQQIQAIDLTPIQRTALQKIIEDEKSDEGRLVY